jgi:hypothetical protein
MQAKGFIGFSTMESKLQNCHMISAHNTNIFLRIPKLYSWTDEIYALVVIYETMDVGYFGQI